MKSGFIEVCLFLFVLTPAISANPIGPKAESGALPINFVALICEVLVVSALLARCKFRFFRIFVAWLFVTQVTLWYLQGAMDLGGFISRWGYPPDISFWIWLLATEALVVLLEAWIIMRLSETRFFRDSEIGLSREWALAISIAGNAVSLAISLL